MITRLHSKYPDLARRLLSAPQETLLRAVEAAVRFSIRNARLEAGLCDTALTAIDRREYIQPHLQGRLEELQRQCDDEYLAALDSLEADQELSMAALNAFHRARALAALVGAFRRVDALAAAEIVYEAIASTADESEIVSAVSSVLE